jgi:transcriptional regulator with XRE-family HTH domain
LRTLRERAGSPSYRQIARKAHFAVSTISDATSGRRLPTEQVVRAFAEACGEDPDVWADKLRQASHPPAVPEDRAAALPGRAVGSAAARGGGSDRRFALRWRWVAGGAVVLVMFAGGVATGTAMAASPRQFRDDPTFTYPAADGADPIAAGCTGDAQLLDKTPVLLDGIQVGALELKYSKRCRAGWARVYLYPSGAARLTGTLASVEVTAADGTASLIAARLHQDIPDYTNVIQAHGGCLSAAATLDTATPPIHATLSCDAPPS